MPSYGVDCSDNNSHPINYQAVVNELRSLGGGATPFVIVKIAQGTGYENPDAVADIAGFKAAGAVVAGYLMDQGNDSPGAEEALYKRLAGPLPQTDDVELPEGLSSANYIAHAKELVAQDPAALVYLNQSEVAEGFPDGAGLWLAEYNGAPGTVSHPCVIHQYSQTGSLAGASGEWDMNVWLGTEEQFDAYFGDLVTPGSNSSGGPSVGIPHAVSACNRVGAPGQGWVVGTDGGVFSRPNTPFYGSMGGKTMNASVIDIISSKTGNGYYLLGADGAVFCFGDATFWGSYPGLPANLREGSRFFLRGELTPSGNGYVLLGDDLSYYTFGS